MIQRQYDQMFKLEEFHWWFCAKKLFISRLFPSRSNNLNVLDIGCGTGGISQYLERWGRVTRLEPSASAQKYLVKKHLPFLSQSIQEYSEKVDQYDAVFILDVLYHKNIQNDELILKKIYSLLKPNGLLCITDCAIPKLFSHHDIENHARERYTKRKLVSKVEAAGFLILRSSYIYCYVFPLFMVQRIIDKKYELQTVSKMPKILNSILLTVCRIESWILLYTNYPFGSSIIVIARKQ